ncbi:hypothetical protein INT44_009364 [Umbelopsis vinacea]|uniref:Uncharacterized protein n=1 Tax=Umbelopsis vinacea TaxID=44442 RepID=A0A8H7Q0W4_9FUNG|nr:hypothetical protein INT44_009364 [Umbelopsis vinacea]
MANKYSDEFPAKEPSSFRFRFGTVPSAVDDDSDNDTSNPIERITINPAHAPKQTLKKQTKRMSMTSDLSSTPNGGDEWRMAYAAREEVSSPQNDKISYAPLSTDQGYRPKVSLTERFLVGIFTIVSFRAQTFY